MSVNRTKSIRRVSGQEMAFLLVLVVIGILGSILVYQPSHATGSTLEIRQNGRLIEKLPLSEDTRQTISSDQGGTNTFMIQDGIVSMESADCGDHTCIETGKIKNAGETIVCLPHRLVLKITSGEEPDNEEEPDVIAR